MCVFTEQDVVLNSHKFYEKAQMAHSVRIGAAYGRICQADMSVTQPPSLQTIQGARKMFSSSDNGERNATRR